MEEPNEAGHESTTDKSNYWYGYPSSFITEHQWFYVPSGQVRIWNLVGEHFITTWENNVDNHCLFF